MGKPKTQTDEFKKVSKKAKNLWEKMNRDGKMCEEWSDRLKFRKWYMENMIDFPNDESVFCTSLLNNNEDVYSPSNTCFIPKKIYSIIKKKCTKDNEGLLKEYAEEYRSYLRKDVYEYLITSAYKQLSERKIEQNRKRAKIDINKNITTLSGNTIKILKYTDMNNIKVMVNNKDIIITDLKSLKNGIVTEEDYKKEKEIKNENKYIQLCKKYVGQKKDNLFGTKMEITKYFKDGKISVKFDDCKKEIISSISSWDKGNIHSPYNPTVCGIGFVGEGKYSRENDYDAYILWLNVINRSYSETFKTKNPTYQNVTASEKWHNFQNFAEWYYSNYVEGWQLDKDLLGNRREIYSEENCCFIPKKINMFLKGRNQNNNKILKGVEYDRKGRCGETLYYRASTSGYINGTHKYINGKRRKTPEEAQQDYIEIRNNSAKELANMFKDKLCKKAYDALINYDERNYL